MMRTCIECTFRKDVPSQTFHNGGWTWRAVDRCAARCGRSVLAVGDQPSLAHSYGVFGRADDYDVGGDPWLQRGERSMTTG